MEESISHQILTELKNLNVEFADLKSEVTGVKLEHLATEVDCLRNDLNTLIKTVSSIQDEVAFISHKSLQNEKEIFHLRKRIFESKRTS